MFPMNSGTTLALAVDALRKTRCALIDGLWLKKEPAGGSFLAILFLVLVETMGC